MAEVVVDRMTLPFFLRAEPSMKVIEYNMDLRVRLSTRYLNGFISTPYVSPGAHNNER